MARMDITPNKWPLKNPFIIARGTRTETETLTVTLSDGDFSGRGECVPTPRYGETVRSVKEQLESVRSALEKGLSHEGLQSALAAGAARNALDAAFWDLRAKTEGLNVGDLSTLGWPQTITTVQTISIGTPQEMSSAAAELKDFPALKIKLNAENIVARVEAVRAQAPRALFLADANESWTLEQLNDVSPALHGLGVVMIEQPLKAGKDAELSNYTGPVPIFADESCHTAKDVPHLVGLYQGVNIKLDKTGGLTEAITLNKTAKAHGLDVMVGCMVSSSLGIAPALFLAQNAKYVDVDAPVLLAKDRDNPVKISQGVVQGLDPKLWGGGP